MEIFEATLALLAAALILSAVAGRLAVPYPSFLVLGGLVLGFLPVVPGVQLDPDLAFALFLPPILFEAAYYTSWRDFRANLRPIFLLAMGLVLSPADSSLPDGQGDRLTGLNRAPNRWALISALTPCSP